MHPRFSISLDPSRDLVTIVMTGLLVAGDVADFFEARRKVHARLRCASGRHVTLTDVRALKILPRETVDAFTQLLAHPQSRARRLAFVVAPTLLRGQLTRMLAGRDCRLFSDPVEAEAWLMAEDESLFESSASLGSARGSAPLRRSTA
jgi:hypothetical protein